MEIRHPVAYAMRYITVILALWCTSAFGQMSLLNFILTPASTSSSTTITPYAQFYASDVTDTVVTQWVARTGSYTLTNWSASLIYAPWRSSAGEICLMSNTTTRGMRFNPYLPCYTNMALCVLMRREQAVLRMVGLGSTASASIQGPFVYTDNKANASLGFATQTQLGSGTLSTGLFLFVIFRNTTSQWARINGTTWASTSAPASTITYSFDSVGFLANGIVANECTNRLLNIAAYNFGTNSPTTNDATTIETKFKNDYPELSGVF